MSEKSIGHLPVDAPAKPDASFEIRISGLVPTEVLHGLGDVQAVEQELRTVLSGRFPDQAALYGFLHRLRALGIEIVEVRRVVGGESNEGVPLENKR